MAILVELGHWNRNDLQNKHLISLSIYTTGVCVSVKCTCECESVMGSQGGCTVMFPCSMRVLGVVLRRTDQPLTDSPIEFLAFFHFILPVRVFHRNNNANKSSPTCRVIWIESILSMLCPFTRDQLGFNRPAIGEPFKRTTKRGSSIIFFFLLPSVIIIYIYCKITSIFMWFYEDRLMRHQVIPSVF